MCSIKTISIFILIIAVVPFLIIQLAPLTLNSFLIDLDIGLESYDEVERISTSKMIDLGRVTLHVNEAGNDRGELIVFIHGFPETGLVSWKEQIPYFSRLGYKVVVPDLRCYNGSTNFNSVEKCNHHEAAKDIVALIRYYKREKAIIVGHDWGSAVSWEVANEFPEVISKLVILAVPHPNIVRSAYKYAPIQYFRSLYFLFFSSPLAEWTFTKENFYWLKRLLVTASNSYKVVDLNRLQKAWAKNGIQGMFNYYRFVFHPEAQKSHYRIIEAPVLLIMGSNDKALDTQLGEPTMTMCKNGKFTIVEAGHFFQREIPSTTNRLIEEFLQK